jgi:hypothetical protein
MATQKQPTFPDPPLEVGIAQYPTPNVPDYYTRDGHIILVEKVSIEKGNYNPQPLDGSVKYAKRDANDWPDDLYLVFQQTEPTGKFVFNYWANDRTLASQDPWNYGLTYSLNDPTTPIITRLYIVPRDEYATVPLGSVDPVFGGDAIVASQTMAELPDDNPLRSRYVQVQRVYETIPSSVITGQRLTERGDLETLDTQVVVAGTAPDADGLLITQTAIEAIDAVKSKRTKGSVASYSTLTTKAKKAGLLGEVSISDDIVPPSTNPDSLTTSIIDSTVEAISATKSRKRTTTSTGPTQLSGVDTKAGLLGSTTSVDSIVTAGSAADPVSLTVLQSSVTPIDSAKSKKTTVTSTGPTSLVAQKISDRGEVQTITKSIVASNTGTTTDSLLLVSSQVDEIDSAKSQKTDITVPSYVALTTKSKKAGLLGEASISDEIVSPSTNPDSLSTTIIDSTVEAISATKSRKRTTTSTGPSSLSGNSKKEGLLGQVSVVESIVAAGASSDNLSTTVISSEVTPIDSAKSKKTTITSTGPDFLAGATYKDGLLGETEEEQSIVAAGSLPDTLTEDIISSQVIPIDSAKSKKVTVTATGPTTLTAERISERGDTQTITKSIVPASEGVTSDTLLLVSSQVDEIDSAKSRKTDTTVASYAQLTTKSKKSGLLGSTSTTDDIVAPTTEPDALSLLIIDSSVEAISATKSRKRTTTSDGPTQLDSDNIKSGLLGETTTSQSIVAYGTAPDALSQTIVSSSVEAIDEYKSRKTTVESTGPTELTAKKLSDRGDVQTITKSIVSAATGTTTDSLNLVSSQVDEIDSAKSQKTDVTVDSYSQLTTKANKSGLLGNTETTDDIVDPSTYPDELSTTIIESSVEAISATKSRKRTTTSTGPTSLEGVENKGGLLGEITTTESIVAYGEDADPLSISVIQSSVIPIDEHKSKKTTIESKGPTELSGASNKGGLLGEVNTTEEIVANDALPRALSETVLQSEVTPIDSYKSKRTTIEASGPSELTAKKLSERGDVQTITKSIVSAATGTTTDSLTLVSSQVDEIDSAKSQKTDVTVDSYATLTTKTKKSGLLGESSTTDDIVDPSTNPDALSQTVLDSTVEAVSATKSRKRTTTSTGPTSLGGASTKSGLLGNVSTTESIVAYGTAADAVSITVIQSEVTPIDSAKSKKTTITSTGPTSLTAKKISERGDVQTITKSIVTAATGTTTDSLTLVSSQVDEIDAEKSQKTDVTVASYANLTTKSKKAGLLGEVSISDDIVSPSTNPDALSTTVIDSTVEAISATKSRRRTTTATGPTQLEGIEYKPGLLGKVTKEESIVASGSSPDELSIDIIQSDVTAIDSAKSKKTTITSSGPTSLAGVENKAGLLGEISTTESIVEYGEAAEALSTTILQSFVTPIDEYKSKKTTIEATGPTELDGIQYKAGLLGKTTKNESIVAYGSSPDQLSATVLDSSVEPIDGYKSKKTTIEATGPTSLFGKNKKAGLLGETNAVESIVLAGSDPDDLTTSILSSEVTPIDEYKSKKTTITSTGPAQLEGIEYKPGLLGITSTTESIVASGSSPDELSTDIIKSEVTPIDSAKSKKTTTSSTGPTALDGKTVGEFGFITTGESIVSYGSSLPTPTRTTVKLETTPIDLSKSKLINYNYDSLQTITGYQYDDFFQKNLIIEKSIIDSSTGALSITDGILSYKDEPIDPYKKQRIVVRTPGLPPSRTEYKTGTYTSPLLIFGLTVDYADFSSQCGSGADIRIKVTPTSRSAQSNITTFKTITSYSYGSPAQPGDTDIFSPTLQEINYTGYVLSFNYGSALCDALTPSPIAVHTCVLPGPYYNTKFEQWNFPATQISASQYQGFIGQYKKVSWESKYWKAGIWEQKEVWVKLI